MTTFEDKLLNTHSRRRNVARRSFRQSLAPRPASRRGVLMLVVLSMLVLFMLIGTAFLMSSNQAREAAKGSAKMDRLGNHATRLLDRAVLQVLRDTENPFSSIRYHSLLRDIYGTDGFQGVVYRPQPLNAGTLNQVTRFSGASPGTADQLLGPTQGQFIDIYVRALLWNSDDPLTAAVNESQLTNTQPDQRHVLKLDRDILGLPQLHSLPLTKDYYNGCLLTITSGPAAGQTGRIVGYDFISNLPATGTPFARLYRFRVMAFPRADGKPLQVDTVPITNGRSPEISDLAGQTFIVNGRPFNGTGMGFNPMAVKGKPRLNALQLLPTGSSGGFIGTEIALTPNSTFLQYDLIAQLGGAFADPCRADLVLTNFLWLNDPDQSIIPVADRRFRWKYQSFAGPGDADESYDAADFQNMWLALQTVTPRGQGRVVHNVNDVPTYYEVFDPEVYQSSTGEFINTDQFVRLDLDDVPWPSFHRPDLVNFWYHRMLNLLTLPSPAGYGMDYDDAVAALIHPYGPDGIRDGDLGDNNDNPAAVDLAMRDFIVSLKRKIMLRPIREDHPRFDGSNPQSTPTNLSNHSAPLTTDPSSLPVQIAVPYWEAVGPWDVDNDNDGVNDSVWVDIGDPIIEAEDGTRYKPLYAYLILDLDSRLNVNAHGLVDHLTPPLNDNTRGAYFDPTIASGGLGNLAHDTRTGQAATSLTLPSGLGYGTPEISLRPIFPMPWSDLIGTYDLNKNRLEDTNGNRVQNPPPNDLPIDSYAALLLGRTTTDRGAISGKLGYEPETGWPAIAATPGLNYRFELSIPQTGPAFDGRAPDPAALLKFFEYPWVHQRLADVPNTAFGRPTSFGTSPDLMGRYALGMSYTGQPVYEVVYDKNENSRSLPPAQQFPRPQLTDSPYELDLSRSQRRDTWSTQFSDPVAAFTTSLSLNDDAAFATSDLERVLRAFDADAGTLPSRLWDVVDAFDPVKLAKFDPYRVTAEAIAAFGDNDPGEPERLAAAQHLTSINRRLVTTDSFDLPVPAGSAPNPDVYAVGADGMPGRAGVNDDQELDTLVDEPDELNAPISDDFRSLFGKEAAQASIYDLLRYKVWVGVRPRAMQILGHSESDLTTLGDPEYAEFLTLVSALAEARLNGEPFNDLNNDGVYNAGDTFTISSSNTNQDINQNGAYDPPLVRLLAPELIAGKRMDLNRPFGDGRDSGDGLDNDGDGDFDEPGEDLNNDNIFDTFAESGDPFMNGVVDDPLEAGDPYLDINGNGKRDDGTPQGTPPVATPIEPFLDIDGDGQYSPPRDQLWQGQTSEPVMFDHTNGQGEPLHPAVAGLITTPPQPRGALVRNLDSQARQHYARHLYCLMLLLVDEGYVAPVDENDPQIAMYLDFTDPAIQPNMAKNVLEAVKALPPLPGITPEQRARQIMLRKLTCRMIAQWAVNCVDMRDPDAIMTPFEYDENPWDGWGTVDANGALIPLDGDPTTNENGNEKKMWEATPASPPSSDPIRLLRDENYADVIDWNAALTNGTKVIRSDLVKGPSTSLNQTRGLVWGSERPELLITETLAFHDRRAEDMISNDRTGHDDFAGTSSTNPAKTQYEDYDLDQSLRPWGRLFVELYNPWSDDGQRPIELYRSQDGTAHTVGSGPSARQYEGVRLDRLSNFALDTATGRLSTAATSGTVRRSPVWRMIVVEEWPDARNLDDADDLPLTAQGREVTTVKSDKRLPTPNFRQPQAYRDMAARLKEWNKLNGTQIKAPNSPFPPFYPANPDFDPVFNEGFLVTQKTRTGGTAGSINEFNVIYPYVEREFYFTTGGSPRTVGAPLQPAVNDANFQLRIPDRSIRPNPRPTGFTGYYQTQKFIAAVSRTNLVDVSIAPILPGRYAVVGSAGPKYTGGPASMADSFATPIGRFMPGSSPGSTRTARNNTSDSDHLARLGITRRIELRPDTDGDPNTVSDPDANQFMVAGNGGLDPNPGVPVPLPAPTDPDFATAIRQEHANQLGRSNELIKSAGIAANVSDSAGGTLDGRMDSEFYQPCVAIPVEGMSISEPPWGWAPREAEAGQEEDQLNGPSPAPVYQFNTSFANGEGRYMRGGGGGTTTTQIASYDKQFDFHKRELMRTGTTPNYRTIHLQRLANPLLPWNPPPGVFLKKDASNQVIGDYHEPNIPVNPYRTIDTASVDLTAFNGVSDEGNYPEPPVPQTPFNYQPRWGQYRPWVNNERGRAVTANPSTRATYVDLLSQPPRAAHRNPPYEFPVQAWHFRSNERGQWAQRNFGRAAQPEPFRTLWSQEPANVELRTKDGAGKWIRILDGRDLATMRVSLKDPASAEPEPDNNYVPESIRGQNRASIPPNRVDMVLEHTLGFGNESFGKLYTRNMLLDPAPTATSVGAPVAFQYAFNNHKAPPNNIDRMDVTSTYPWLPWNNRPLVSANELLQVPAASSSLMLRWYSTINPAAPLPAQDQPTVNPYASDGYDGAADNKDASTDGSREDIIASYRAAYPFGHLLNFFAAAVERPDVADVDGDSDKGEPIPDSNLPAPHFYRILEYVQVPSRFVGTETRLNAETFHDVPKRADVPDGSTGAFGSDIVNSLDPRYNFQPPFNQVSRERDPGRVNLNTVTGRRQIDADSGIPNIWSEVYDGIMHRYRDGDLRDTSGYVVQLGHAGPAWRDVVLSRRGYFDVSPTLPSDRTPDNIFSDVASTYLNPNFPSIFSNPFRSPDAGDMVPLDTMRRPGVQAGLLRSHPYTPGNPPSSTAGAGWGQDNFDDPIYFVDTNNDGIKERVGDGIIDDAREAGYRPTGNDPETNEPFANDVRTAESAIPLFSEASRNPLSGTDRNPYMKYQPMTRLGNMVSNRSGVFAVWVTVGYFEVEKAPDWNDPDSATRARVRARFGGDTPAAEALYNRVYPDGYMLGREVGIDTGDVKRARGFYIIDRTEEVGFKPGDDLNVERTIRLRRRIE